MAGVWLDGTLEARDGSEGDDDIVVSISEPGLGLLGVWFPLGSQRTGRDAEGEIWK